MAGGGSNWYSCVHEVNITPLPGQFGIGNVTILVADRAGLTARANLRVFVKLVNHPPIFTISQPSVTYEEVCLNTKL